VASFSRKAIRKALFARLKASVQGIRHWSMQPEGFDEVKLKPALVLVTEQHVPTTEEGLPTIWTLQYTARVWTRSTGLAAEESPDDELDDWLDQIHAALKHQPNEGYSDMGPSDAQTTLGGLCQRAWVSGPVQFGTVLGGDSFVDVPIEVVAVEGT
jgi:hypothetical protein